jgi:isopentenyl diphosphate isomerase/L-lactate dehydrogenase-like FMN-dependent dehydrogenase
MAGQIIKMINKIIAQRAQGNPTIESTTRTKLVLKGINPAKFNATSPDDPEVIKKLQNLAAELGVSV